MNKNLTLLLGATLLTGCSAFNTVHLYRDYTSHQTFMGDRQGCVNEAQRCIVKVYENSFYHGEAADQLLPSRAVYLSCMSAKGYFPVVDGFVPPVLVKMNDYPPGRDCGGG